MTPPERGPQFLKTLCAGIGGALWRQGYSVEEELRPPFISRALAHKLLRAGKTLNFLRWRTPGPSLLSLRVHSLAPLSVCTLT